MTRAGSLRVPPGPSPALQAVAGSPPRQEVRTVLVALVAAVAVLLAWSMLAELDIVATAPARLVPASQVKPVQVAESGVVSALLVSEGMRVRAGDVLLRLDPTIARAEGAQVEADLHLKRLIVRAIDAELAQSKLRPAPGSPRHLVDQVREQFAARRQALDDAVANEGEAAERARHEKVAQNANWKNSDRRCPRIARPPRPLRNF